MTKIEEMQNKLSNLLTKMQDCLDNDKLDDAAAVRNEIQALQDKISAQIFIDEANQMNFKETAKTPENAQTKQNASYIRACLKKFGNKPVTDVENSLLLPTSTYLNGANGEGYILPQDIQTQINRKIREYRSFRDVLGYIKTTALKGAFPVENLDSLAGLVDFADGTDGTVSNDISFTQVTFSLAEKGAFVKLSNTLLALTDNDLVAYIVEVFAKKAVITENAMAKAALQSNKTVKTLANWKQLKSSINKDLDPAAYFDTVIVTNQDGFDYLDSQLDENGRPVMQPDISQPTQRRFMGYPVIVFSNAQLASSAATTTAAGYAPIYYGSLKNGCKFVDAGLTSFAASSEAGFMSNTTVARLIEFVTVVQCDSSDKCYCYGQLQVEDQRVSQGGGT